MGLFDFLKPKPGGTVLGNLTRALGINRTASPGTSPVGVISTSQVAPYDTSPVGTGITILDELTGILHGANKTLNQGVSFDSASLMKPLLIVGGVVLGVVLLFHYVFRRKRKR